MKAKKSQLEYFAAQLRSMHQIGPCFRVSIFEGLAGESWPQQRGKERRGPKVTIIGKVDLKNQE